jgi:hypothetical protein
VEAAVKALVVACLVALSLAWAGDARATDECNGLDVCISVPGPWVAVPAAAASRAQAVYYELSCPRRTVVGGLDAILGDRSLDVRFLGRLGSPVNPGITTTRSALFVATSALQRATYFRPYLGCIPTSGGGGRGTTSVAAAGPRHPPVRRVRALRVRPGVPARLVLGCGRGERLVGSSHAVALRMPSPPTTSILGGVTVVRRERGGRVDVRARRSEAVPASVRVEVQVHALCAGRSP